MKLSLQQVFDVTLLVSKIINEQRALPQKGKYRLARMHVKLLPEFTLISAKRDEMIQAYATRLVVDGAEAAEFTVPAEKMKEYSAAWEEFARETIELEVEPIPLASLDLGSEKDGSIQAYELVILGDLVKE